MTARATTGIRLQSTEELVAWMFDEYLSELVLLRVKPKPRKRRGKPPSEVVFEWGLEDLEYEGERDKYFAWRLTAEGVTHYTLAGELDLEEELTVAEHSSEAPIGFTMNVGGQLTVGCEALLVEELKPKYRKARPRPWPHDFDLRSTKKDLTVGDLVAAFNLPEADEVSVKGVRDGRAATASESLVSLARQIQAYMVSKPKRELVVFTVEDSSNSVRLGIQRRDGATDEEWHRVWQVPTKLPQVTETWSRTLVCPPDPWPPSAPEPREPKPRREQGSTKR